MFIYIHPYILYIKLSFTRFPYGITESVNSHSRSILTCSRYNSRLYCIYTLSWCICQVIFTSYSFYFLLFVDSNRHTVELEASCLDNYENCCWQIMLMRGRMKEMREASSSPTLLPSLVKSFEKPDSQLFGMHFSVDIFIYTLYI